MEIESVEGDFFRFEEFSQESSISPAKEVNFAWDVEEMENKKDFPKAVGLVSFVFFSCLATSAFIASIVKRKRSPTFHATLAPIDGLLPPPLAAEAPPEAPSPYPRCSDEDTQKVKKIFSITSLGTLAATKNVFFLKKLGNEIDPIHPFAFLAAIPPENIQTIFKNNEFFVMQGTIGGIDKGMRREAEKNNLYQYIPDFAKAMKKQPLLITQSIQLGDWKGLVRYLFDIPSEHGR